MHQGIYGKRNYGLHHIGQIWNSQDVRLYTLARVSVNPINSI